MTLELTEDQIKNIEDALTLAQSSIHQITWGSAAGFNLMRKEVREEAWKVLEAKKDGFARLNYEICRQRKFQAQ